MKYAKNSIYDFSISASREETNADKYTLKEKFFGTNDVMPFWVADMDIDTPDFVLEAVEKHSQINTSWVLSQIKCQKVYEKPTIT